MPFNRPPITDLISRAQADFDSRLPGTDARLRRSNTGVLARVSAGGHHGLHGHLDWLARNLLLSTADDEGMIEAHCLEYGISRKPAAFAAGEITLTGADGAVLTAGAIVQRSDGVTYKTTAAATIASGSATVAATATAAGITGNCAAATPVTLLITAAGINATAAVATGDMTGGLDIEDIEVLRARGLRRKRLAPHSGAAHDYVNWTLEIPGITRVWCLPLWTGDGHVGVTFVLDGFDGSVTAPNSTIRGQVAAYIALHDDPVTGDTIEAPVNANVIVFAPTLQALNPTIHLSPDTPANRAAVTAELTDLLYREGTANGGTIYLSHLNEAISVASGEFDHTLTSPSANVTTAAGTLPVLGTITWA